MKLKWIPTRVKLGQMKAWEGNPRMSTKAQAKRIIDSEKTFGQPVPFILNPLKDGMYPLLDGHQRLAAWFTVYGADYEMDAMVANRELTEAEHKQLIITLHTGATGEWNWQTLSGWNAGELQEWGMNADTLKQWNNDANNLKEMLKSETAEPVDAEPQIDRAAELQEKWQTSTGQLWKLGDHRLLIGDCTVRENVERLMGGERADMMFTDPPYGVDYTGGHFHSGNVNIKRERERLESDKTTAIYWDFLPIANEFVDGACYMWFAGTKGREVFDAVEDCGFEIHAMIIWHKINATYAAMNAQYKQRHEPCLYFKSKKSTLHWVGKSNECTVWEEKRDASNEFHPTQKPIVLAERAIGNHDAKKIIDFFAGSGSTIIAAQNLSRRCYAMEISPNYGAVILERFYTATGITPELTD